MRDKYPRAFLFCELLLFRGSRTALGDAPPVDLLVVLGGEVGELGDAGLGRDLLVAPQLPARRLKGEPFGSL